ISLYQLSASHFLFGWFFFFLIYFPARLQIDRKIPWLKWVVAAPFLLRGALLLRDELSGRSAIHLIAVFYSVTYYTFLMLVLFLLTSRYFVTDIADERRRLRLFYWGTLITLVPIVVFNAVTNMLHYKGLVSAPPLIVLTVFALLAFFPVVLAYVIVVQRAMDVRVVVRQGIRYALASRGVNILRGAAIIAVIYAAVLLTDRREGVWPQVVAIGIGILAVNSIRSIADHTRKWIDRRFFREQLRTEELLGSLANDVHRIMRTDELVQTVAQRIASSLHVDRIGVWLMNTGGLVPAYAANADGWNVTPMLGNLRDKKKAVVVDHGEVGTGAEVVVPLAARDDLLGTIVLGAKRSEEPYSRMELEVLETVGSQAGLALDNSRLATSLAQEAAQRERLNREIEIAREVQQTLLPQGGPDVPGIEYAGVCRPALGVGGDYYDFLQLPGGRFGFAIGDVSGKGVAAALLMASLQASLRGQTLDASDDLASIVSRMSRLLFEATAPNRYATFFYAQYDPSTRGLAWVNAGHNAPFLFHNGGIRRLDEGGSVIGLLPDMEYVQGSAVLSCGDLVLAFTDGISESMNARDEEWGEARLCAAVAASNNGLPIEALLKKLLESADAHAAGAPQHDDMTLVAIRALPFART
ncbi:MAG TPA: GAF domain-containing SpoIIE family protein phosphatase, partial [Candidatus Acidoferrales bacterium]